MRRKKYPPLRNTGYKTREALFRLRERETEKALQVLRFLLHRFCLVEKSKVIAEYQQAKALFDEALKENALYVLAPMATKLQVLNLMYPEIGKEVEG